MSTAAGASLAARVVALVALVALASALVTGVAIARVTAQGNRDKAAASLSLQADNLAERLSAARPLGQRLALDRLARQGVTAVAATPGGGPLPVPFTAADVTGAAAEPAVADRTTAGQDWLVVARPVPDGRVALLAEPLQPVRGLSAAQRWRAATSALVVLAVGAAAGLLLARRIARPLRRVASVARRLSAGERDVRVGTGGPREVADVAVALNGLAAQLSLAEDRQRAFLLAVSHELRTPLTAVTGYAEALADGVLPPEEVRRAGEVVLAEAGRLQRRIEDLSALARLQADGFELHPGESDVAGVVRAAADAWRPRAAAAGIALAVEAPAGPLPAWVDAERLRQAVDVLADNALRVVPAGRPVVLACGAAGGDRVWVQVRDGGPGLDAADLELAFEPGRLAERYRGARPVGSGLGLALAAGLTRRMGGTAEAAPAPEGGVAFTLTVPVEQPTLPTAAPGRAP